MTLDFIIVTILTLLFIKHFLADWVFQTNDMVYGKGILFNIDGLSHSIDHGIGTGMALIFAMLMFIPLHDHSRELLYFIFMMSVLDIITHYVIDYTKQNYCKHFNYTYADKEFWVAVGVDQFAHYSVYLIIAFISTKHYLEIING